MRDVVVSGEEGVACRAPSRGNARYRQTKLGLLCHESSRARGNARAPVPRMSAASDVESWGVLRGCNGEGRQGQGGVQTP